MFQNLFNDQAGDIDRLSEEMFRINEVVSLYLGWDW